MLQVIGYLFRETFSQSKTVYALLQPFSSLFQKDFCLSKTTFLLFEWSTTGTARSCAWSKGPAADPDRLILYSLRLRYRAFFFCLYFDLFQHFGKSELFFFEGAVDIIFGGYFTNANALIIQFV